jgi:hypothetical protein
MAFNEKLNASDLQFLDDLYEFARKSKHVEDFNYFQQQVELLIGDLDSPVEWAKYLRRLEQIDYKKKD